MMDSWWQKIIQSELKSTNSYFYLPHSQLVSHLIKLLTKPTGNVSIEGGGNRNRNPHSSRDTALKIDSKQTRWYWLVGAVKILERSLKKKTISHYSGKILSLNRILWGDLMESLSQFGANNTANQHIVTDSNFQVANSMFFLFHLIFTLWGRIWPQVNLQIWSPLSTANQNPKHRLNKQLVRCFLEYERDISSCWK